MTKKHVHCGDVVEGCPWHGEADTEAELLEKVAEHAHAAHGVAAVPPGLADKVKRAIKDR